MDIILKNIDWYFYTKRYVNKRMIQKLPIDILNEILSVSDELDRGYQLKELFLDIIKHANYEAAKEQLLLWIDLCKESNIQKFIEVSKTITNWLQYIVNYFSTELYCICENSSFKTWWFLVQNIFCLNHSKHNIRDNI